MMPTATAMSASSACRIYTTCKFTIQAGSQGWCSPASMLQYPIALMEKDSEHIDGSTMSNRSTVVFQIMYQLLPFPVNPIRKWSTGNPVERNADSRLMSTSAPPA